MVPMVLLPPFAPSTLQVAEVPTFAAVNCCVRPSVTAPTDGVIGWDVPAITAVAEAVLLVPPAPVQLSEKVELLVSAALVTEPDGPESAPLKPGPADAVHAVAFVELQVTVVVEPLATATGDTVTIAVGTMFTVTLAGLLAPPPPV